MNIVAYILYVVKMIGFKKIKADRFLYEPYGLPLAQSVLQCCECWIVRRLL